MSPSRIVVNQVDLQVLRPDSSDLRPSDLGCPVLDLLQLQQELVEVSVGPTTILPTIEGRIRWIAQHRLDPGPVLLEEG